MAPSCKGWKRSSWLSAHLDRPADRRSLGPAGTSCCSTSTAAQVHCEPPNCNSPLGPLRPPPLLVHQTLMLPERIAIAGAVHLFQRGLCCSTTLHTPASSAPDKDLILKLCLFSTQHSGGLLQSITVWLPATVSQSVSANWEEAGIGDRFMGSGANLFFQRNRLRQSYTWGGTTQAANNVLTFSVEPSSFCCVWSL